MNIKIYRDIEQRTDAWLEIKSGKTSGSGFKPIISARTNATLDTYAYKLISELEDKHPKRYNHGFLNSSVEWGIEMEPYAISAFEREYNLIVEDVGWVEPQHPAYVGQCGYSPDGIIDIYTHIEVKCLDTKNHIRCITEDAYPKEYEPQILNYFVCNPDLEKVYFILYDPRLKTKKNWLFVKEINRSDISKEIIVASNKLGKFLKIKNDLHAKYLK
jgi:hypothetical protein